MKKIIVVLFIVMVVCLGTSKQDDILIPQDAIRIRIIANSNNIEEQVIKNEIKKEVIDIFKNDYNNLTSKDSAENIIVDKIPVINNIIEKYTNDYNINYGSNYFPQKVLKGVTYDSGYYDSLVISLGTGLGDNWWCVLYPPLCFIDEEETEYKSLIKELINKI